MKHIPCIPQYLILQAELANKPTLFFFGIKKKSLVSLKLLPNTCILFTHFVLSIYSVILPIMRWTVSQASSKEISLA